MRKGTTTSNYNCYHYSGKTSCIAKQRLLSMQHNERKGENRVTEETLVSCDQTTD